MESANHLRKKMMTMTTLTFNYNPARHDVPPGNIGESIVPMRNLATAVSGSGDYSFAFCRIPDIQGLVFSDEYGTISGIRPWIPSSKTETVIFQIR